MDLERQIGSFVGGVGINTILAMACVVAVIAAGFVIGKGDPDPVKVLVPAVMVGLVVPTWFYARSRLVWAAIELIVVPLEVPGEAPPEQVHTGP